jgi:hypothetical protein
MVLLLVVTVVTVVVMAVTVVMAVLMVAVLVLVVTDVAEPWRWRGGPFKRTHKHAWHGKQRTKRV